MTEKEVEAVRAICEIAADALKTIAAAPCSGCESEDYSCRHQEVAQEALRRIEAVQVPADPPTSFARTGCATCGKPLPGDSSWCPSCDSVTRR